MRVLFINAPNAPFTDRELLIEPIDVLTVASYVKSLGVTVAVHDMDHQTDEGTLLTEILTNFAPDMVVIPFDYHIPLYTTAAAELLLKILPLVLSTCGKVVLGGRPTQSYPKKFLIDPRVVIIRGEMELALDELLALDTWSVNAFSKVRGIYYTDGEQIHETALRSELINLDLLPIPERSLVNIRKYIDVHSILSSRGCVEKCSFCPVHTFWGRWRKRSPQLVVDEIEYLVKSFSATKILFLDDHATADKRRMAAICEDIIRRKISVALGCLGTATSVDKNTLNLMAQAGFRWIHFGAESGSDRILTLLQKRLTSCKLKESVALAKEAGLRVRTSWIMDPPEITHSELGETLKLLSDTESHEIRIHFLAMRACAPLADSFAKQENNELPPQYLHSDRPRVEYSSVSSETIKIEVNRTLERLTQSGYYLVSKPEEWGAIPQSALSNRSTKFVSLCPGKYGVGWQL